MEQTAERLSAKIYTLSEVQLAEVERFIESLQLKHDRETIRSLALGSAPNFEAIWSNPEDDAYDAL